MSHFTTFDELTKIEATLERENTNPRLVLAVFREVENGTECEFVSVRCDRCAHWGKPDAGGFGVCNGLDDKRGAFVADVAEYGNSELLTRGSFGCSMFTPRTETETAK